VAVLEELVAKLGFEVDGLGKLKAAAKSFDATKKAVIASANPLKQSGAAAGIAAVGIGKLGDQSKKSSRGVLLLGTALGGLRRAGTAAIGFVRTLLGLVLRLAVPIAGVAAGVVALGVAFAVAGAKAAKARREFALTAKTLGTTAQNLETGTNIVRYLGLGDDAQKGAEKSVGAINDVLKAIRAGGDEADEARKKFTGFGIDQSFQIDKNGKMRDSVAVLLDIVQAYKQVSEQAATYRKQADAIEKKNPKQAAALRKRALERDRKATTLAEDAGIDGTFKAVLDEKTMAQIAVLIQRAQSERPTTSNASEAAQSNAASQAEQAGLKVGAIIGGITERLTDFGVTIAKEVLPPLNAFLDSVISFAKRTGIIKETTGEKASRLEGEREAHRARGLGGTPEETPQQRRNRTQAEAIQKGIEEDRKRYGTPTTAPVPPTRPEGWMDWVKRQISPETNAAKMQKQAETKTTTNNQQNFGNDQRNMPVSVKVEASGLDAVAAAVKNAVLGAISTKGANTSTGALTAP
jgi:hypothetical protein